MVTAIGPFKPTARITKYIATDVFLFYGNTSNIDLVTYNYKVPSVVTIAGKIWSTFKRLLKILESTFLIYFDRFKYTVKFELGSVFQFSVELIH